jgi:hypothetical protein
MKLKKAMDDAQQAKGYGLYAHVQNNKMRSFHIRSMSEMGI